jgi:hypothetical protein
MDAYYEKAIHTARKTLDLSKPILLFSFGEMFRSW